jgi:hypothetical protein
MGGKNRAGADSATLNGKRSSQLWLSLLEDAAKIEWPPTIEGQNWRVRLSSSESLQGCNHKGLYRTSPVFPVTERFSPPDLQNGIYYLTFFCFDPAFPILGRLLHLAPKELTDGLLYTTGLASILLISKREALASDVERIARTTARSKEAWQVNHGRIASISCHLSHPDQLDKEPLTLKRYDTLPLVAKTTVDEFVANMAVLMPKVHLHIPGETDTFTRLIALANELVEEMVYVCNPVGNPPETLSEYTQQQFTKSDSLCSRILHQDTDRLIQINAALSYVSTQALSGAVPILDRRSLIRRYSLLGVGTATLALTRIAHSIERAFAQGALEYTLTERAAGAAALPGLDKLPDYDSRKWREFSFNVWNGSVVRESYPKLPYFSGRLGFREAEYTVTAALQALAAGAGAEWSLLTITHEMLHGHVRNILSYLFQGDPNRRPDQKWDEFYTRFAARCKGTPLAGETFLDSLRAIILSYCCNAVSHGSLTSDVVGADLYRQESVSLPFPLLAADSLWRAYEAEYRNINEIFVHVLDLHYFYCSCLSHYVQLIWRSWSTVPQVWADLRQYILRSLLVVATKTEGTVYERFASARSRLTDLLENLQNDKTAHAPVINEALKRLKREYAEKHLFFPFAASMILVDVVHHVLTSSTIRGSLNGGDPHFRPAQTTTFEEWLLYDMPDEFVDDVVISPTAYLADRLSRQTLEPQGPALEARTAALFLACASHVVKGAPNA